MESKKAELRDAVRTLPISKTAQTGIYGALMRAGITSTADLAGRTYDEICAVRNIGKKSAAVLLEAGMLKRDDSSKDIIAGGYFDALLDNAIQKEITALKKEIKKLQKEAYEKGFRDGELSALQALRGV